MVSFKVKKKNNIKKTKDLLVKGFKIPAIAKELNVTEKTVENYVKEIETKTNIVSYNILNFRYFWHNKRTLFYIFSIFALTLFVFLIYFGKTLLVSLYSLAEFIFTETFKILKVNLSGAITIHIILIIISLLLIIVVFTYVLSWFKKHINWWVYSTIVFMIFFLITGIFFINNGTTAEFDYGLNDENNNLTKAGYDLKCKNDYDRLLYDTDYECKVFHPYTNQEINVTNITGIVRFKSEKSENVSFYNKTIKFSVPYNTTYVLIQFQGIKDNQSINWSSGRYFNFISKNEEAEIKKTFLSNLFILFTLVFFSIPTMMVNFKKLTEK